MPQWKATDSKTKAKIIKEKVSNKLKTNTWWRPSKYTDDLISKAKEYLQDSKDIMEEQMQQEVSVIKNFWDKEKVGSTESKITTVNKQKVNLPTIEWLAQYLWVSRSNIYKWKDDNPLFSDILEEILEEQAKRLINMSLSGDYNSTITKLLLMKHWYVDKSESEQKHSWTIDITVWLPKE